MLTMYYRDDEHIPFTEENIIRDCEAYFNKVVVSGTECQREIIKRIENGRYYDEFNFIDRFGAKLPNKFLSTGCKTALCVDWYSDKLVDLSECGNNAVNQILITCTDGNILLDDRGIGFLDSDKPVCIKLDGIIFNDMKKLMYYYDYRGIITYEELISNV